MIMFTESAVVFQKVNRKFIFSQFEKEKNTNNFYPIICFKDTLNTLSLFSLKTISLSKYIIPKICIISHIYDVLSMERQ